MGINTNTHYIGVHSLAHRLICDRRSKIRRPAPRMGLFGFEKKPYFYDTTFLFV